MPTPRRPRCAAHLPSRGEIRAQRRQGGPTPPDPRRGDPATASGAAALPQQRIPPWRAARGAAALPRQHSSSPRRRPSSAPLPAGLSSTESPPTRRTRGTTPDLGRLLSPLPSPPGHGGIQGRHIKLRTATARLPLSDTALSSSRPLLRPVGY